MSVFKTPPSIEEVKQGMASPESLERIDTNYLGHYLLDAEGKKYGYGDTVICVSKGRGNNITIDKLYTVVAIDYHGILGADPVILDDKGSYRTVNRDRFVFIPSWDERL